MFLVQCEQQPPNGGLFLPEGFQAVVVVDSIEERVRHMAVTNDGILYGKLRNSNEKGGIVALQDKNNDG
ncbi:MAG: cytochrome C, partial [Arenibacter sp.]